MPPRRTGNHWLVTNRICVVCGKQFEGAKAEWCSNACYTKSRKMADPFYRRDYHRSYKRSKVSNDPVARNRYRESVRLVRETKPWHRITLAAKARAKKSNMAFDLTPEWGEENWTGYCSVTGMKFWKSAGKGGPHTFTATIDRIDNSKGYLQGNCRFVLWCVNSFKGAMTDAQMKVVAVRIIEGLQEIKVAA